jgi:hypothetical protein
MADAGDRMFCHACGGVWLKNAANGLDCPHCQSDFTEIVRTPVTCSASFGSLLIVDIRLKSRLIRKTPPLDPRMTPHPAKRIINPTSTLGPIITPGQMKRAMEETTTHGGRGSHVVHIGPPMAGLLSQPPPPLWVAAAFTWADPWTKDKCP